MAANKSSDHYNQDDIDVLNCLTGGFDLGSNHLSGEVRQTPIISSNNLIDQLTLERNIPIGKKIIEMYVL
jgi:hypothetical protein